MLRLRGPFWIGQNMLTSKSKSRRIGRMIFGPHMDLYEGRRRSIAATKSRAWLGSDWDKE